METASVLGTNLGLHAAYEWQCLLVPAIRSGLKTPNRYRILIQIVRKTGFGDAGYCALRVVNCACNTKSVVPRDYQFAIPTKRATTHEGRDPP